MKEAKSGLSEADEDDVDLSMMFPPGLADDDDPVALHEKHVFTECRTIEDVEKDQEWGRLLDKVVQRKKTPTWLDWDLMDEQDKAEEKAEVVESMIMDGHLTKIQGESLGVAWDMILDRVPGGIEEE